MTSATDLVLLSEAHPLQGYLAYKKHTPARTLQQDYTWCPIVVLGGGGGVVMSEVPL